MADPDYSDEMISTESEISSSDDDWSDLEEDESGVLPHPSQADGWSALSIEERKEKIVEYKKSVKSTGKADRRAALREELKKEAHDWTLKPRLSVVVSNENKLSIGDVFKTRQQFQLRVAEICNLLHKLPLWSETKDDPRDIKACIRPGVACARSTDPDDPFIAKAVKKINGWVVETLNTSHSSRRSSMENARRNCAFTAKQLAPVLIPFIEDDPSMAAKTVKLHLSGIVDSSKISDRLIQNIRETAKNAVLGIPSENIKHIRALVNMAQEAGHKCELKTSTYEEAKVTILRIAHWEHTIAQKKKDKKDKVRWSAKAWQTANDGVFDQVLGTNRNTLFATGVFFSPSPSVAKLQYALDIFSADAAHMRWGDCTLYSLYGKNSDMGAFCLGHGIIAGNEDRVPPRSLIFLLQTSTQ